MNCDRISQLRECIEALDDNNLIAWLLRMDAVYTNSGLHHGDCYFLAQVTDERPVLRVFKMADFPDWILRAKVVANKTLDLFIGVGCDEDEFRRMVNRAFLEAGKKELNLSYDHDAVLRQNQVFLKAPGTFR